MLFSCKPELHLDWTGHPGRRRNRGGEAKGVKEASQHVGKFRNLRIWWCIYSGLEGKSKPQISTGGGERNKWGMMLSNSEQNHIFHNFPYAADEYVDRFQLERDITQVVQRSTTCLLLSCVNSNVTLCLLADTTKLDDSNSGKMRVPRKKWKYDTPAAYYCSPNCVPSWTPGVCFEWQVSTLYEVNSCSEAHFMTAIKPDMCCLGNIQYPSN